MRQVAGLIPTYSSDEFGICSALYELGGMVVMHDASGCNSTYTTHDEPRWYDMDSMIFISAISEMEAIMGDDEKLIDDLVETAEDLRPAFIAIVGAPIPYMIGTDLKAIAAITEERTGIPCIGLNANGMHDYTKGISMALQAVVDRFCEKDLQKTERFSVNIIGATPLDFSLNGSIDSIRKWLTNAGVEVNCCMAMGSSFDEIKKAGQAQVNLVISSGGLAAAKRLEMIFGQPYVVGIPMGIRFSEYLLKMLYDAAEKGKNCIAYDILPNSLSLYKESTLDKLEMSSNTKERLNNLSELKNDGCTRKNIVVIGEAVYSGSVAAALQMEYEIDARVLCPLETYQELLRQKDCSTPEEDDLIHMMSSAEVVIADPFYRILCSNVDRKSLFYELPHEAFSGRIYDAVNPNLIQEGFNCWYIKQQKNNTIHTKQQDASSTCVYAE